MIAAMMLPSSLPLVRLFSLASSGAPARRRSMAGFLGGYALVWSAFGAAAFAGDALLNRLLADNAELRAQRWIIVGGLLALAGAVQFTPLKDRCLTECRHPGAFLMQHYRRGAGGGFTLGRRHGLFCVGCCWALMLVMFVAGVASLTWMAGLTVLMVYEKTAARGDTAVPLAGIALLAWAAIVLVHPPWLPATLGGG
jgi:predicted metal-binding membrane protein